MKPAKILIVGLSWLFVLFCTGCAPSFQILYKSTQAKPSWVTNTLVDENNKEICFVGMATDVESMKFIKGRDDAIADALNQAICYVGLKGQSNFIAKTDNKGLGGSTNVVTYTAKARLTKSYMKSIYYEMWATPSGAQYYDIFVLVSFSTAELKSERERILKEKDETKTTETVVVDDVIRQPVDTYYSELIKKSELKEKESQTYNKPKESSGAGIVDVILSIFFPSARTNR